MKEKQRVNIQVTEEIVAVEIRDGMRVEVYITGTCGNTAVLAKDKEPIDHPWINKPGYDC